MRHIDLCLGCRTCEAVCPSGVPYGRIIEAGRAEVERIRAPVAEAMAGAARRCASWSRIPRACAPSASMTRAAQAVGLTSVVRSGRQLPPLQARVPRRRAAASRRRSARDAYRVAFLVGCVMPILYPQSHDAAVRLLQLAGCEVWFPPGERCCGALLAHNGDLEGAERLRDANMRDLRTRASSMRWSSTRPAAARTSRTSTPS